VIYLTTPSVSQNVAKFKYFGKTVTNLSVIHEELSTLNSGNACYQSVQNPLCSRQLSKNVEIKMYENIFLPAVGLYGCET
jgi:hypothetical protein